MNRIILAGVVGTVLSAGQLLGGTIQTWTTAYNGGMNGGEFRTSLDGGAQFATFCVELGETFVPGTVYSYELTDRAYAGGGNAAGTPGYDVLSAGSAWLYLQFVNNTLDPAYYSSRNVNAGYLQNAFWALEDEKTYAQAGGALNPYLEMVVDEFGSFDAARLDYTGSSVRVINVFTQNANGTRTAHQDLIGVVPDGGATMVLFGMGLLALGGVRRMAILR